jgi:2,4-dienoyl-CoA reductase-like NADH-dependent reductase (Old Yellow Enzyme family)
MSILFTPVMIGNMEVPNRLVCSATYEGMALESGGVTDELISRYGNLAKGGTGLIISGHMYVHPRGRAARYQTGIYEDLQIPGLRRMTDAVHREGGKMLFQLSHAGRQTSRDLAGETPAGPYSEGRDPMYFVKPRAMDEDEIQDVIRAFGLAAARAVEADADGVQIHAAHCYLINQFLSPYFNRRNDEWGGSDENRFRFLREVVQEIRKNIPGHMPLLVKLNTHDHTPSQGVTPELAAVYAGWLVKMGIEALEVSCGSVLFSFMNMCRGEVPVEELVRWLPWWKKPMGRVMMKKLQGRFDLEEAYNLEAARTVRANIRGIPLILVGGMRTVAKMEEILEKGDADLISMSRPFIREPFLAKRIQEGKTRVASCVSCNRCLAAAANELPIRCYNKGLPEAKK